MHPSGYPDAAMFGTASEEWRLVCFARWICRLDGLDERLAFFGRLSKRHGPAFAEQMKLLTQQQWMTRAQWAPAVRRDELVTEQEA